MKLISEDMREWYDELDFRETVTYWLLALRVKTSVSVLPQCSERSKEVNELLNKHDITPGSFNSHFDIKVGKEELWICVWPRFHGMAQRSSGAIVVPNSRTRARLRIMELDAYERFKEDEWIEELGTKHGISSQHHW